MRRVVTFCLFALVACGDEPGGGGGEEQDAAAGSDRSDPGMDAGPAQSMDARVSDPSRNDNHMIDTDCDGLSDAEELGTIWGSGMRTDPDRADSDNDGLLDGLEIGRTSSVDPYCASMFGGDADPSTRTDPTNGDTDGDGLLDGIEDANHDGVFGRTTETDPKNADSDGDGYCDGPNTIPGVCTGGDPDPFPAGMDADRDGLPAAVDPDDMNPDYDGDGLCDGPSTIGACLGGEDIDADGAVGPGETNPRRADSDCDGLSDSTERSGGTDPSNGDTDGDGLADGIERGITMNVDPVNCPNVQLDRDPNTMTDPNNNDSDGDMIPDGAEDSNQNGMVDPGELDPQNGADGATDPTVREACALENLVPVDQFYAYQPDQQIITAKEPPDEFAETSDVRDAMNRIRGKLGYNAEHGIAYVALTETPRAADAVAQELAVRAVLENVATLNTPITRAFTTWDGWPAVQASYEMIGDVGTKTRANAITEALLPGATGLLPTANEIVASGGFHLEVEYVYRSAMTAVVLIALIPVQKDMGAASFVVRDLGGGSALGQHDDSIGVQCDRFITQPYSQLDILWSVDNSVSMADEQGAVAASAAAMNARLSNAPIDWRVAVVGSGFYNPGAGAGCTNVTCADALPNQCRTFTTDITRFSGWLTETSTTWIGAGGPCNQPREEVIYSAQLLLTDPPMGTATFMPPQVNADPLHLRANTNLVLILLGDADDQRYGNAAVPMGLVEYQNFFNALPVSSVTVGGILCPAGEECGETQRNPRAALGFVNAYGGVLGSLRDLNSIPPTVAAIIDDAVGGASPYVLSRAAIASTIKVAMEPGSTIGNCNVDDVPRDRTNGFDYDPQNQSLIFFGDCRPNPATPGAHFSVSYRYWRDETPDADPMACGICADCLGASRCDLEVCACVCDVRQSCGTGYTWSEEACDCVCDPAGLNCPATHMADTGLCACTCLPSCGGCASNEMCQPSLCECRPMEL